MAPSVSPSLRQRQQGQQLRSRLKAPVCIQAELEGAIEKGSCTFNTRGRLECATFVLHRGRRHDRCSSGLLRGEVSSWRRAYGREGRGWGRTIAGDAQLG